MKPLILTGWLMPEFTKPDFADLVVDFPVSLCLGAVAVSG